MKKLHSLVLVFFALRAAPQTPAANQPVSATIDASKTAAPIPPYTYGQFFEHIGSSVYSSLQNC